MRVRFYIQSQYYRHTTTKEKHGDTHITHTDVRSLTYVCKELRNSNTIQNVVSIYQRYSFKAKQTPFQSTRDIHSKSNGSKQVDTQNYNQQAELLSR